EQDDPVCGEPKLEISRRLDETGGDRRAGTDAIGSGEGQVGSERAIVEGPAAVAELAIDPSRDGRQLVRAVQDVDPQGARPLAVGERPGPAEDDIEGLTGGGRGARGGGRRLHPIRGRRAEETEREMEAVEPDPSDVAPVGRSRGGTDPLDDVGDRG